MATKQELAAKASALRKTLSQIDKLTGKQGERERDAERKREQRKAAKNVDVPDCADRGRREEYESQDERWLRYYCGELFWYEFTPQQLGMIEAIRTAILYGGDQALAASRGEGKTKLFERMLLKYTLQGTIKFSVLFAATAAAAVDSLNSIRDEIEQNELLLADYPEVCVPVRALENTPNRAHYQVVSGKRHDTGEQYDAAPSRFTWCGNELILPNVPGSPAACGIIATRGLDSAVRGLNKKNQRPQVVGIDDPDTEETVNNVVQANKLEARIDRGIGGLGGQQRGVARIMLTTLQSRDCASAWFTDPERKPSWKGRRFKFLLNRPENIALWEEYMQQRQEDQRRKGEDGKALDPNARRAHQFYLDHRAEMDRGAKVANEHRFNGQVLPDGTQLEVSALQRYFNEVARIGWEAVATEYDNDPPEQSGPQTDGISAALVMSRVNGREQRILPRDTIALTAAIDIGKYYCHWVVTAWREQAIGCVVDYGIAEVVGVAKNAAVETVERAIYRALLDWRHQRLQEPYYDDLGEIREMDAVLVDSGDYRDAVYSFIRDVGGKPFLASKGIGSTFREHAEGGSFWNVAHQPDHGIYLYTLGSDHWKRWVHERFLTPTFDDDHRERPGSLSLWTPTEPRKHQSYAHHIVAEEWREDFKEGRGVKKYWHKVNANNHWLDATYMACAAANMCGVTLMPSASPQPLIPKPSPATVERFVNPTGLPYLLTER